jgi:hypothetical protein
LSAFCSCDKIPEKHKEVNIYFDSQFRRFLSMLVWLFCCEPEGRQNIPVSRLLAAWQPESKERMGKRQAGDKI